MTGPRLKESGPELTEVRRPRLTRGATPPALCAPVSDRRKAFPPARFTVVLEATARSTFRTLLVSRTAGAEPCTRRERYVERLWSGSCSPRRAISARLQAQCRPSVSPVGQSLRAVGRSGVGSFSALLLRSASAAALLPLLRSAPCSTTGRIHSHRRPLLAVLSDQLRWLRPAVVQGLAENAHVELLRRRLLPRRRAAPATGGRADRAERTHTRYGAGGPTGAWPVERAPEPRAPVLLPAG